MVESNKKIIMEIVVLSVLSLITIFIFPNLEEEKLHKTFSLLSYNSDLEIVKNNDKEIRIRPGFNEMITEDNSPSYQIVNHGKETVYDLILVIDKETTYDLNYFNYKIDDQIRSLNDCLCKEDESNYYYYLNSNKIGDLKSENITFNLWLPSNYPDDFTKYKFIYQIIVQNSL